MQLEWILLSSLAVAFFLMPLWFSFRLRNKTWKIRSELQEILDTLEPVALINSDMIVVRVNYAFSHWVGLRYREIVGKEIGDVVNQDKSLIIEFLRRTASERRMYEIRRHAFNYGDEERLVDLRFHPILKLDEPSEYDVLLIFRDYTNLYRAQMTLQNQKEKISHSKLELEASYAELDETRDRLKSALDEKDEELEKARETQQGLLPQSTDIIGMNTFVHYQTVQASRVGGDFYDFIQIDAFRFGIFLGDVAGHGVSAAFIGALAKMALVMQKEELGSPVDLMVGMNESLKEVLRAGDYMTGFYGVWDVRDNSFFYARAGHPAPLLLRASGDLEYLESKGLFIGIFESPQYELGLSYLNADDRLLMFTDGCFELSDRSEKMRLRYADFVNVVSGYSTAKLEDVFYKTKADLLEKVQLDKDWENEDDETFIALEVTKASRVTRLPYTWFVEPSCQVYRTKKAKKIGLLFKQLLHLQLCRIECEESWLKDVMNVLNVFDELLAAEINSLKLYRALGARNAKSIGFSVKGLGSVEFENFSTQGLSQMDECFLELSLLGVEVKIIPNSILISWRYILDGEYENL